jgi:hypothetical protein
MGFLVGMPCALGQTPPTLDSIEAQVVVIQQQVESLQNCCNKYSAPIMLNLPAQVGAIQNEMASINLQLSTLAALEQLGLSNQAQLKTLQAEVAALQNPPTK